MAKIVLDVDNKDKETVLLILKSLKQGMIKNIQVDNVKQPTYSGSSINKKTQKQVQKALDDEFLPKPINSNSKYLSKEEFKARLNTKG